MPIFRAEAHGDERRGEISDCFRMLVIGVMLAMCELGGGMAHGQEAGTELTHLSADREGSGLWESGVGEGFRESAQSVGFSLGANVGYAYDADNESHHLGVAAISYSHMLGPMLGKGHWYGGNLELRGELFAGGQYSPEDAWFVGFTPVLRYNFMTGTEWVPFVEAGAGVTATSIGGPDLGGTFQFNERAGFGTHYFFREKAAWTGEMFYVHWSNGGRRDPNAGLNGVTVQFGMTVFF